MLLGGNIMNIEESQIGSYKVQNSFYEINPATMWICNDTVRDMPYRQNNKISKLKDKPLTKDNHYFDE